jgi:ABC-type branched-subunit amino acid transport system ATPase component
MFRALTQIRASGVGVLLVEQNARASLDIADRVYLIESGRNAGSGPASAMKNDPEIQRAYLGKARLAPTPT